MRFGWGAWIGLLLVTVGAILWTEGMLRAIRSENIALAKAIGILPFVVMCGGLFSAGIRIRKKRETEKVWASLRFRGRNVLREPGTLRRDGGLLVFEGPRLRFALGHDAFKGRPVNLLTNNGARLIDAPEGTVLQIFGETKTVREWGKGDSEPTRERVPLLIEPEKEEYPKGWVANVLLFSVGCAAAGAIIGGYLDFRGLSPNGRPMAGVTALAMGGTMAMIGFGAVSTKGEAARTRTKALEAGFRPVETLPFNESQRLL